MKFLNTIQASPVAQGFDLPHRADLLHCKWTEIPMTEPTYKKYLKDKDIHIDIGWWNKQMERCKNGIFIPNAIEKGGDNFVDGVDAIWHGNDVYLPEYDYWIMDRNVFITPRQYWYLNFWHIKRLDAVTKRKKVLFPKFTDLSWENYLIRYLADTRDNKDILWTKSRQKGLSEEEASEIAYDFTFYKESQSLIVSGEQKYAKNSFNFCKRGLKMLANTQFYKWTSKDNEEEYISKFTGSEIYMRTSKDNPQCASALSPSRVLYEEIGIWEKDLLTETSEFIRASQEAEGIRTSVNRYTGTGGEMESGVDDMQEMFHAPDDHNLMSVSNKYSEDREGSGKVAIFIPCTKFEIIDKEGNSLIGESRKSINLQRKSKSAKKRYRFVTQKPFSPEELFAANPNGFFGESIIAWASARKTHLLSHKELQIVERGRMEWITDLKHWKDGAKFVKDPEGDVYISEHPRTYVTRNDRNKDVVKVYNCYKAGTDSYDQDEAKTSTSKGSCWIKKGFLTANDTYNKYVAYVTQRPEVSEGGRDTFYENTAKLTVYYGTENLVEHSKILIFVWYQQNGMSQLLKERPRAVIASKIMNTQVTNDFGIDASFLPWGLKMQRDYWSEKSNIDNIDFVVCCDKIMKFRIAKNYNCDDTIAQTWGTVAMEEEKERIVRPENPETTRARSFVYKTVNGRITQVKV